MRATQLVKINSRPHPRGVLLTNVRAVDCACVSGAPPVAHARAVHRTRELHPRATNCQPRAALASTRAAPQVGPARGDTSTVVECPRALAESVPDLSSPLEWLASKKLPYACAQGSLLAHPDGYVGE